MKRHYKIKEENKIKLKTYLDNAVKKNSAGNRGGSSSKRNGTKRNNL